MYDSTNAADIPADATMVAGYVNGVASQWSTEDWARFPNATKLRIDVLGNSPLESDILDIESGDARPQDAPGWIAAREAAGLHVHTLYCNMSTKPFVDAACRGLSWQWFAADPTGTAHLVDGSVATQWAWPEYGSPGHYDLSWIRPGAVFR